MFRKKLILLIFINFTYLSTFIYQWNKQGLRPISMVLDLYVDCTHLIEQLSQAWFDGSSTDLKVLGAGLGWFAILLSTNNLVPILKLILCSVNYSFLFGIEG